MIDKRNLKKENTAGKVVAKIEEKRKEDKSKSSNKTRKLVSRSIFDDVRLGRR